MAVTSVNECDGPQQGDSFESLNLLIIADENIIESLNHCCQKIVKPESRLKAELAALLELGHPGGGEPNALNREDYQQS